MMTKRELILIRQLLEALKIKCKSDALYTSTMMGINILEREIEDSNEQN